MYPFALLNDPPAPTYERYQELVTAARSASPRFVDPANLYVSRDAVARRGDDWVTAILGFPYDGYQRITVTQDWMLKLADEWNLTPDLPGWIVEGRAEGARRRAEQDQRRQDQQAREVERWTAAAAQTDATFEVHHGSRGRARGNTYEPLRHAVPTADVYSGRRAVRVHPAGRAVCESPTRANPLDLAGQAGDGEPVTCVRCLTWVVKVRSAR